MAYLTDKEKRLLFSALSREKKICKQVDKECCREAYEDTLESVVKKLEKKFYYDRFEKEIRAKAIDEFVNTLIPRLTDAIYQKDVESMTNLINDVARELKAGNENE